MTFWTATFLSDYLMMLLPVAGIYLAFVIGDTQCFIDGANLPYSLLLFLMFGFASLPMTYLVSLFMSRAGVGISLFIVYNLAFGKDVYSFAVCGDRRCPARCESDTTDIALFRAQKNKLKRCSREFLVNYRFTVLNVLKG